MWVHPAPVVVVVIVLQWWGGAGVSARDGGGCDSGGTGLVLMGVVGGGKATGERGDRV